MPHPIIFVLTEPLLRESLTAVVKLVGLDPKNHETKDVHPSSWLVKALNDTPSWPDAAQLRALVSHPVLTSDYRLLTTPGYDRLSGVYLDWHGEPITLPQHPTQADAAQASTELLGDIFADFMFESDAHKHAVFAALLTLICRPAIDGPTPGFLVDANVRGAGKGMLVDTIVALVLGQLPARMAFPDNDEELRKRLTAVLKNGPEALLFDNITGRLAGGSLDLLLTAREWADRILGSSTTIKVPVSTTMFFTGNNMILGGDLARRMVHLRLNVPYEKPESRTGFRHDNLTQYIREHRPALLVKLLTLVQAWLAAGRPIATLPAWGSYEAWSATVRQIMVFAGLSDPILTKHALEGMADDDGNALIELIQSMQEAEAKLITSPPLVSSGWSPQAVAAFLAWGKLGKNGMPVTHWLALGEDHHFSRLRDAFAAFGFDGRLPNARQLGRRLSTMRARVVQGLTLTSRIYEGSTVWTVRSATKAG